jgi:amino acid adenylation domain-containing protein
LFSALLNYRYSHADPQSGELLEGMEYLGGHDRTNYPFTLHVDDLGESFEVTAEVHERLNAERICDFVLTTAGSLVSALETAPDLSLAQIEVLPPEERRRVLQALNGPREDYAGPVLLHQLFEAQARRTPEAPALWFEGRRMRYAELDSRSNRLAWRLRDRGVGPDALVAVLMERSEAMVIALLAILKSGGAYLPLDPGLPEARLRHILGDSSPVAVLTDADLAARLPPAFAHLLLPRWPGVEEGADAETRRDNPDPTQIGLEPRHLAYVIYTSGSTGAPKGVMIEHRGIVNRLRWMQQAYDLKADDVVLQKTPYSFDVSVWEFFWPLMAGACLAVARPDGHRDPAYLDAVIGDAGVTTLHFVPAMLRRYLQHRESLHEDLNHPRGEQQAFRLKRVIYSGETLPAELARRFHERLPGVALHNLYGPTEAAVDVTAWTCVEGDRSPAVPIGRPIANTRLYILDACQRPVPAGVKGEIYIAGVQVARGYLNRPELTTLRFIPDPFAPGQMYRTGDLGRWREDGALEYLGRNDFQVKVRGFRIEPEEIESRLMELPEVGGAVVAAHRGDDGEQVLVAYLTVQRPDLRLDASAVRAALKETLPEYMIPVAYIQLETLPLTHSGKVDRKALPSPQAGDLMRNAYEAPIGEAEHLLAQIWSELLGVERVSRNDSFFELGGHSLLAMQLLESLRSRHWQIDIRALFSQPGLAAMAAALQPVTAVAAHPQEPPGSGIPEGYAALATQKEIEEFRL